jgi:hypothetical protein
VALAEWPAADAIDFGGALWVGQGERAAAGSITASATALDPRYPSPSHNMRIGISRFRQSNNPRAAASPQTADPPAGRQGASALGHNRTSPRALTDRRQLRTTTRCPKAFSDAVKPVRQAHAYDGADSASALSRRSDQALALRRRLCHPLVPLGDAREFVGDRLRPARRLRPAQDSRARYRH